MSIVQAIKDAAFERYRNLHRLPWPDSRVHVRLASDPRDQWVPDVTGDELRTVAPASASVDDLFADASREGTVDAWQHLATYLSLRLERAERSRDKH